MDPAQVETQDHPADQGDPAGPPVRPAGRPGAAAGDRPAARHPGHRGRRPGPRGDYARPAGRHDRARAAASASTPARTSGRLRRGRGGRHRRRRRSPPGCGPCATTPRSSATTTTRSASTTAWTAFQGAVLEHQAEATSSAGPRPGGSAGRPVPNDCWPTCRSSCPPRPPAAATSGTCSSSCTPSATGSATQLEARGIQTGLHYPIPLHLQQAYAPPGLPAGDFPVAERIGRECLTLPLFPEMTEPSSRTAVVDAPGRRSCTGGWPRSAMSSIRWNGPTVLVTGGAGLIGSHIVDRLIDAGAGEIRVLDNLVRGRLRQSGRRARRAGRSVFIEGDVRDREAVAAGPSPGATTCSTRRPSASPSAPSGRASAWTCWSVGTFNVFEAAVAARVKKVVYASSASVYGAAEVVPHRRDAPPVQQPHPLRRRQADERGDRPQLPRHVRPAERRPALLQRLRPADGRDRGVHRGLHPLARLRRRGAAGRRSTATARPRWTSSTSTTSPGPTWRPEERRRRRRLQRRQRDRDVAAGALAGDPAGDRAGSTWSPSSTRRGRSTRSPAGWPTRPGPARPGVQDHRRAWKTGCGNLPPGGPPPGPRS